MQVLFFFVFMFISVFSMIISASDPENTKLKKIYMYISFTSVIIGFISALFLA